ncbi:unnamed protein product [Colias eurytheme]|nr:unnamed protein product [Colias eurytheme]
MRDILIQMQTQFSDRFDDFEKVSSKLKIFANAFSCKIENVPSHLGPAHMVKRNCNESKFKLFGKEADDRLPNEPYVGVVGQTVLNLLRIVPRQQNHIVYFDNFYTSLPLMCVLAKEGIHSLGTIQRNRLGKSCKLPSKQDVMKKTVARGSYDEYVTNFEGVDITTVSWKDNKQVILASTYVGAEPVENIDRFDKKEKRRISIPCPKLIKEYNAHSFMSD